MNGLNAHGSQILEPWPRAKWTAKSKLLMATSRVVHRTLATSRDSPANPLQHQMNSDNSDMINGK